MLTAYLYGAGHGCYAFVSKMPVPGTSRLVLRVDNGALGHVFAAMLNAVAEA